MSMYLGLMDRHGRELSGKGYCRVSLEDVHFKLVPPRTELDDIAFVNADTVMWPVAQDRWPEVRYLAFYNGRGDRWPVTVQPMLSHHSVPRGAYMAMRPAQLLINTVIKRAAAAA